jgi:hypothetical protein
MHIRFPGIRRRLAEGRTCAPLPADPAIQRKSYMKRGLLIALAISAGGASAAEAAQFTTAGDIYAAAGYASSYTGAGVQNNARGGVADGGRDAFDGYGYYKTTGGLTYNRQTEVFAAQNLYRFFDTFTNNTAQAVTRTVTFYGNLGSDSRTKVQASGAGFLVTCEYGVACSGDPVVAAIYGNNGLGVQSLNGENYSVDYVLHLAPGQSASILNLAFLASSTTGTNASDVTLASDRAQALAANPFLDGLTSQQVRQIVNFGSGQPAAVPEPASWAFMIGGFGMVGASLRRRQVPAALA